MSALALAGVLAPLSLGVGATRAARAGDTAAVGVTVRILRIGAAHVVQHAVRYESTFVPGETIYVYVGYRATAPAGSGVPSATIAFLQQGHALLTRTMTPTSFVDGAPAFVGGIVFPPTQPEGPIVARAVVRLGTASATQDVTFALRAAPAPAVPTAPPGADTASPVTLPPLAPVRGFVIGRAIFADGRPMPHFTVAAFGYDGQVNPVAGTVPYLGGAVGSNGRYALRTLDTLRHHKPVNALVAGVTASATLSYHGVAYVVEMAPRDGRCDAPDKKSFRGDSGVGVVRDFVLRLSGVKPCWTLYRGQETTFSDSVIGAFYGGSIHLDLSTSSGPSIYGDIVDVAPKGSLITLTLVPRGPLLDGSIGHTLIRRMRLDPQHLHYSFYLFSLPQGSYTATAQITEPGTAARPLRLRVTLGAARTWEASMPVTFAPTKNFPDGSDIREISAGF